MRNNRLNSNNTVVLGLIGAGGRGTSVIINMQKTSPDVEVKYICDVDASRGGNALETLEHQQGRRPQMIEDLRNILDDKDVDAVVIATPEHWHALATIWACQAGKDVFVEKNISMTIMEGIKMIEASRKYHRIIQCGTQNRSAEYAFSARDYIRDGNLGNIVHVKCYCMLPGGSPWILKEDSPVPPGLNWDQWLGPAGKVPYNVSRHKGWYDWWAYSGGLAFSGDASHGLDLTRLVLGDPGHPQSVYCAGGRILYDDEKETPDIQVITYDYGNFSMTCEASQFGKYLIKTDSKIRYGEGFPNWPFNSTRIEIYGTRGMMYLGRHGGGWQVFGNEKEELAREYGMFPDTVHQQNFIDCIRNRKKPNGDIEQGHMSASLVHLGNMSYRTGEKLLYVDSLKQEITNSPEANKINQGSYRQGFELPDIV